MASRLDRLLLLLDTGSSQSTRRAAAEQLGEVQKLHPHELQTLLAKVLVYLRSDSWDTRIAAGYAIEAIVKQVPSWEPAKPQSKDDESIAKVQSEARLEGRMGFSSFNITRVLKQGTTLLGSAGDEYDIEPNSDIMHLSQSERAARQRKLLQKRLGLDGPSGLGFDKDLFEDDDLVLVREPPVLKPSGGQQHTSVADLVSMELGGGKGLSAREKNRARRKAKKAAKNQMKEVLSTSSSLGSQENIGESDGNSAKRPRTSSVLVPQGGSSDHMLVDAVADVTATFEEAVEWPFEFFCDELCNDLFNPKWTIRHGAAIGLREVLKIHARGAGKTVETPVEQMEMCNFQWLEDVALRLLCVFALDRFGDYLSDEVVAPVREMCAQTLGVVVKHMVKVQVLAVLNVLLTLQAEEQWQVRYGGLLGSKYLLAVRQDMTAEMLPLLLSSVKQGLGDLVDDVRAVAATSLLPVTDKLILLLPQELPSLLSLLWDTLVELDDLTASTNGVMSLLASLYSCSNVLELTAAQTSGPYSLAQLVPRLWPFLGHTIMSVRQATIRTLDSLLACPSGGPGGWLSQIFQEMLQHLYQRLVLEPKQGLRELVLEAWIKLMHQLDVKELDTSTDGCLGMWFSLAVYPANVPIDSSLLALARHKCAIQDRVTAKGQLQPLVGDSELRLGGVSAVVDDEAAIVQTRLSCAKALAHLGLQLSEVESSCARQQFIQFLLSLLSGNSAIQRLVGALIITEWAMRKKPSLVFDELHQVLVTSLDQSPIYDEVMSLFGKLQTDCQNLLTAFLDRGVNLIPQFPPGDFSVDSATTLVTSVYGSALQKLGTSDLQAVQQNKVRLTTTLMKLQAMLQKHHVRVQTALAAAVVVLGTLPAKLNPVIRPLMESIKKEENETMQRRSAVHLAQLLGLCRDRSPCPNVKIVKNLCTLLCADPDVTPRVSDPVHIVAVAPSPAGTPTTPLTPEAEVIGLHMVRPRSPVPLLGKVLRGSSFDSEPMLQCGKFAGIVTFVKRRQAALIAVSSHGRRGAGHTSKKQQQQQQQQQQLSIPGVSVEQIASGDNFAHRLLLAQCRGSKLSLLEIVKFFGVELPEAQPKLWESTVLALQASVDSATHGAGKPLEDDTMVQELVQSMQVFEVIVSAIDEILRPRVLDLMPQLCALLQHGYCAVRHMAARCIAAMTRVSVVRAMEAIIANTLPLLSDADRVTSRQGAMEVVAILVDDLGMEILPYAVLLIIPLLGRMSDQEEDIRLLATQTFASLVRLMPLEAGVADPPGMASDLAERRRVDRRFLEQLLDPKRLDSYAVSVPIKTDLRKYQQDGVNWLGFLNKYKLHGILCDDMGLGKTLQTICIIAGDHHDRLTHSENRQKTGNGEHSLLPSLVVCPPTLTGHWCYEVEKFCSPDHLNVLHYTGGPAERQRLWKMLPEHNLVVASYDIVRNDIDCFRGVTWNYVVLDEGHVIRNGKTKLSKAIKSLKADHRLILTGTPIQNNVLELWSLFDFLMPGFLGTEKEFAARYSRPILQSRDAKSSSKEQEAGVLAMEALHRQVLPFMLRRLKEDVLQDLPPKIIQDYYCDLSPLQVWLYEDFAKSKAKKAVEKIVVQSNDEADDAATAVQTSSHIFQALQYLRKLCNHPLLVVNEKHPRYEAVKERLSEQRSVLRDIRHAGKLIALKQLLLDCGIGVVSEMGTAGDPTMGSPVVGQHRVLIFCQLKSMLDVIENELLGNELPSVSFLRLDGTVPAGSRYDIVRRFNCDPSIDVLLLTTHVGGLGLNLTGADTVIFVEHDWNPMRDLQAMDRAHRIGQKKVVNVYRLITRGTLEEKIMGLQKFKLSIANTVVTQDNSSLQSMGTSELLDLFDVGDQGGKKEKEPGQSKQTMKGILENMESLWDEKQYETEYDLGHFMESLN